MSIFSGLMFLYFTNIFSILGVSIFHILGDIKNLVFFRCSGNFCLLMLEWTRNALLFLSNICLFWDTVFLGILKNLFFSCLGISCLLIFEWMWNALFFFWSDIFSFWDLVFFWLIKNLFLTVWAFHVYSCLSGCGMPYFFSNIFPYWDLVFFSHFWVI